MISTTHWFKWNTKRPVVGAVRASHGKVQVPRAIGINSWAQSSQLMNILLIGLLDYVQIQAGRV